MVVDFGFLKDEMIREIDVPCDHGMIMCVDDPFLEQFLPENHQIVTARSTVKRKGVCQLDGAFGKMYIVPFVPTAEKLAEHWYGVLAPRVVARSEGKAVLASMTVYETPNCFATYVPNNLEELQVHAQTAPGR
jgi:6-pyruvoyltetrahydropterin/6-carboxytetrahydropterin synthase